MSTVKAYAATSAKAPLEPFEFTPGPLGDEQVDIAVDYCGICHSDLSVLHNDWGNAQYPLVPGHEASGRVVAAGPGFPLVSSGPSSPSSKLMSRDAKKTPDSDTSPSTPTSPSPAPSRIAC